MRLALVALVAALVACSQGEPGQGSAPATPAAGGLGIVHEREGTGRAPGPSDLVEVHYHGTFADGSVFDSSVERGEPAKFPLNRVIPCWTQGLQRMKVGGKARLTCPPELAYGASGAPPTIPPNSTLVFEVELLGIE
jgi:FKBP-type peptidyl-prolyl cis-trans isomerase FkpA